uniref:Large ribosomal subunit protein bL21c n=1 Tax=Haptophyceae sp. NIES-3900 TaxID=2748608 RepID=A0A7R6WDA8_9EUKA|nr:ribosomal protein L27 [Haptophyceae sp. NIES-3900]
MSGNYAIVEASGKQLWVEADHYYDLNRLPFNTGDEIILNRVLALSTEGSISIGQPCLQNSSVKARVLRHLKGPKITVYKMRPKKKTRLKKGHRQELTRIVIDSI